MGFVVHVLVEVRNQGQLTVGEVMYRDMAKANSRRSHTNTLTQINVMHSNINIVLQTFFLVSTLHDCSMVHCNVCTL